MERQIEKVSDGKWRVTTRGVEAIANTRREGDQWTATIDDVPGRARSASERVAVNVIATVLEGQVDYATLDKPRANWKEDRMPKRPFGAKEDSVTLETKVSAEHEPAVRASLKLHPSKGLREFLEASGAMPPSIADRDFVERVMREVQGRVASRLDSVSDGAADERDPDPVLLSVQVRVADRVREAMEKHPCSATATRCTAWRARNSRSFSTRCAMTSSTRKS